MTLRCQAERWGVRVNQERIIGKGSAVKQKEMQLPDKDGLA